MAFHEAGHTVTTMVVRGWKAIDFVTINGPKEAPGYLLGRRRTMARLSRKSSDYAKRRARGDIVILHGGTFAQMHYERALGAMRGKPTRYHREACIHDMMEAMALASRLCRGEKAADNLNERLARRSREIVEECWAQVIAVARALLDEGTVSGEDLWDVACSPARGADPWIAFDDLVLEPEAAEGRGGTPADDDRSARRGWCVMSTQRDKKPRSPRKKAQGRSAPEIDPRLIPFRDAMADLLVEWLLKKPQYAHLRRQLDAPERPVPASSPAEKRPRRPG